MRFYTQQHLHYCGVDLHARTMYLCVVDQAGEVLAHCNLPTSRERFLKAVEPYREDLVVAVECLFCWYWLADLCADEGIDFVLGHALYMKAIHGGKSKNDRVDSFKIAHLLRGGNLPQAYVYPRGLRSTRDLLRRRLHFTRKRAELMAHVQNTLTQYNLEPFEGQLREPNQRSGLLEHFEDESVQVSIACNLQLLETYDTILHEIELYLAQRIRIDNNALFYLLRSIPGVGEILAMTLLYEIHEITRFPRVQDFLSYARLVAGTRESAGKKKTGGGKKIGNVHLKWAFSEAAVLFLSRNPVGQKLQARLVKKHGKGKALGVLAAKLGRAVYYMLRRHRPFDMDRFVTA